MRQVITNYKGIKIIGPDVATVCAFIKCLMAAGFVIAVYAGIDATCQYIVMVM